MKSRRKPKWHKLAANWAGYFLMTALVRALEAMPFRAAAALGDALGNLVFVLSSQERTRALENLAAAFGREYTSFERRRITRRMFCNFARTMCEAVAATKLPDREILKIVVNAQDFWNHMKSVLAKGKGVIAMTGHLGNWEMMGGVGARMIPANVIANRFAFEPFNRLTERLRTKGRMKTIYLNESAREIVRALKRNELVGILPDQDIRRIPGVFVDFFGKKAWTPIGPVLIAKLSGAPMHPYFMVRREGKFFVEMGPEIPMSWGAGKNEDLVNNTGAWSRVYEGYIRNYPDQWAWNHLRWKTRPEDLPEAFKRRAGMDGQGPGDGNHAD